MINLNVLEQVEEAYLKHLPDHFHGVEDYKWEAVKHFQNNWNIDASDFPEMLDLSLGKTYNLLASGYYYARKMIVQFAKEDPEGLRELFRKLYDESRDLSDRIKVFIAYAEDKKRNNKSSDWKSTFQDLRAISVYLWLRYPDKYYIYKYAEIRPTAEILESDILPYKSADVENLIGAFKICDQIHDHIIRNHNITDLIRSLLTDKCYPDPEYRTLTADIVFYISRYFGQDVWFPVNYNPGFTVDDWVALLNDNDVFGKSSLTMMKRLKDIGGQATCTELSEKYGRSKNWYNTGASSLAKRIVAKTNCPTMNRDAVNYKYWPVLFVGKSAPKESRGSYIWKLRPELDKALDLVDLSKYPLYSDKNTIEMETDADVLETVESVNGSIDKDTPYERYTVDDFLSEVFMDEEEYLKLKGIVLRKKNVILQGAPGVGKTFTAKRLAYSLMGMKDNSRVAMIQFHQNYTYEDFIMGYKPDGADFKLKTGIFYDFCNKARRDPDNSYFFIIDEINRGNLSKIFGELLQLIEADYRGEDTFLAYNHEPFSVPDNLYIIGMMNTADRSLALIDYALRRRFSFYRMSPGFGSKGFKEYQTGIGEELFDSFINAVVALNKAIAEDPALGDGFQIGHSYLCLGKDEEYTDDWLHSVLEYDIIPTLQEYWFDDKDKLIYWENLLGDVFNG